MTPLFGAVRCSGPSYPQPSQVLQTSSSISTSPSPSACRFLQLHRTVPLERTASECQWGRHLRNQIEGGMLLLFVLNCFIHYHNENSKIKRHEIRTNSFKDTYFRSNLLNNFCFLIVFKRLFYHSIVNKSIRINSIVTLSEKEKKGNSCPLHFATLRLFYTFLLTVSKCIYNNDF